MSIKLLGLTLRRRNSQLRRQIKKPPKQLAMMDRIDQHHPKAQRNSRMGSGSRDKNSFSKIRLKTPAKTPALACANPGFVVSTMSTRSAPGRSQHPKERLLQPRKAAVKINARWLTPRLNDSPSRRNGGDEWPELIPVSLMSN
jgi:hypothetical protein